MKGNDALDEQAEGKVSHNGALTGRGVAAQHYN
jgi:hypothetical protein